MSPVRKPGLGELDESASNSAASEAARREAAQRDAQRDSTRRRRSQKAGGDRLDLRFRKTMGMRVELRAIKGVTRKGVLKVPYRFQCPPTETFERQLAYAHSDFDTLRAGQHSRPTGRQLSVVNFSTLVVDWDASFALWPKHKTAEELDDADRDDLYNVLNLTRVLERILALGTPVRLRCGQPGLWEGGGINDGWDVDLPVTLRTLGIEERAAEVDTRYLGLSFTEFRSLRLDRQRYGRGRRRQRERKPAYESRLPTTVELFADGSAIDRGDNNRKIASDDDHHRATLHRLAMRYYGSPYGWKAIMMANPLLKRINAVPSAKLGEIVQRHNRGHSLKIKIPRGEVGY